MKKLLLSLLLVLVVGCSNQKRDESTYVHNRIPLQEIFTEIAELPYELDRYDCSQKSVEYYYNLKKRGYTAMIVLVPQHAFVWVEGWGFYDPTRNQYFYIKDSKDPVEDYNNDWRLGIMYGQLQGLVVEEFFRYYNNEFVLEHNDGNL